MKKLFMIASMASFILVFNQGCKKEKGCTLPEACNYNPEAEANDASCTFATVWYEDKDGDGLGDASSTKNECDQPEGYVDNSDDDFDDVVSNKQRAVFVYKGATWCPPCGSYGDPTKEHVSSTYGSDCIILSSQAGDAITSSNEFGDTFGDQFQSHVGSSSIPHGYWTGQDYFEHRGFYTSQSSNNSYAENDINTVLATTSTVGITATARLSGGSVEVDAKVKFFSSASSTRYISVFLVENNVIADQSTSSGTVPDMPHDHIIRATATTSSSSSFGLESLGSSFPAGEELTESYTISNLDSGWNTSNLEVVVMVWDEIGAEGILNAFVVPVN